MKKVLLILGEFEDADIEWLVNEGNKLSLHSGTQLITEGKPIDALFFVADGSFSVSTGNVDGSIIGRVETGEVLGEVSFVDGYPPSATVTAENNATVLAVPHQVLSTKIDADPAFAARFYRAVSVFLADRLRAMDAAASGGGRSEEELSLDSLDKMSKAGIRFERILKRLRES